MVKPEELFPRNKSVKLAKKAAHIYVIIKGHNGKSGAEKETRHTKRIFTYRKIFPVAELMR